MPVFRTPFSLYPGLLAITLLCGCQPSCEQNSTPPEYLSTNSSPLTVGWYTSDLSVVSARWENVTASLSGDGMVTGPTYECFFLVGCDYWMHVEANVDLILGMTNLVTVYTRDDTCEWRHDYQIDYF